MNKFQLSYSHHTGAPLHNVTGKRSAGSLDSHPKQKKTTQDFPVDLNTDQSNKSWHEQTEPSCDCHGARFGVDQITDHQKKWTNTQRSFLHKHRFQGFWWSLCIWYLLVCQVSYRRPFGSLLSNLYVTSFECPLTPFICCSISEGFLP